jgi:hypothetical protein
MLKGYAVLYPEIKLIPTFCSRISFHLRTFHIPLRLIVGKRPRRVARRGREGESVTEG